MIRAPIATLILAVIACVPALPAAAQEGRGDRPSKVVYTAHLHPMNSVVTKLQTTGEARFTVAGDSLTITVAVKDAPPGVIHWQHFHGFKGDRRASCATASADTNHDGILDLIETEPASGTTMVPFIEDPVSMQVAEGKYPKASPLGTYEYRTTVSLAALMRLLERRSTAPGWISTGAWCSSTASGRPSHFRRPSPRSAPSRRKSRCRSPVAGSSAGADRPAWTSSIPGELAVRVGELGP